MKNSAYPSPSRQLSGSPGFEMRNQRGIGYGSGIGMGERTERDMISPLLATAEFAFQSTKESEVSLQPGYVHVSFSF
jgi:hypothetical protein